MNEFHSTKVYSFLRRAEFGFRDHDPAVKTAIILEFLVATINTEQYSHFPLSWFCIHGDWHPSIMKNLSFHFVMYRDTISEEHNLMTNIFLTVRKQ